jgi:Ca2+-transporting ATPase
MNSQWHSKDIDEIVKLLHADAKKGLSFDKIEKVREKYGKNELTQTKRISSFKLFLVQFNQPLVYILLAAAIITAFLDEWVDSSVIFGVLLVNAIIGFIQESKALKAIDALSKMSKVKVTVIRDDKKVVIDSTELVVGDIVILYSGDKVPADMRIVRSKELQIDEASLTGESVAVSKNEQLLNTDTLLADRKNMLYSSTYVTYGSAMAIVVAVGDATEIGHINTMITKADVLQTPLTQKISYFSKILLYVILLMAFITFVVGVLRGESVVSMFMASVALAVGAIPEGLPAAMTIILAIGVSKMADKQAIIRKLPAVETLGSTTVICSDKTGTLTQNEMTVKKIYSSQNTYDVSGVGYSSDGEIILDTKDADIEKDEALKETLIAGVMCNSSTIVLENENYKVNGDPTEGALIISALKAGIKKDALKEELIHIDTLVFESQYQYMASYYSKNIDYSPVFIKGSVEKILQRCDSILSADNKVMDIDKEKISKIAHNMAQEGLRVLAFARVHKDGLEKIEHHHLNEGLTFLGLQGMIDPPRLEVIDSIKSCHEAGIKVKMITGDHSITALAIANQIGIKTEGEVKSLNGSELENLDDSELEKLVDDVNVYARVAPEQKLRLVKSLQNISNVVAMTGDGVNDAPALKQANIGTAMGITGTEVAKESADMILLDDNFSTIKDAVEEGRGVFDNIVKFITWTMPTNVGEGLVIMAAVLFGLSLPILPVQILWINMTTAVFLGLMLSFEPKEKNLMQRKPREVDTPILTNELIAKIVLVGFLLLINSFGSFWYLQNIGFSEDIARTVAVNIFVFGEMFYLFNCRSIHHSAFEIGFFSNRFLIYGVVSMTLIQVLYTYAPFMNTIFKSEPLGFLEWGFVVASSLIIYVVVELHKKYYKRLVKN